jgi:hypothetical protein
MEDYIKTKYKKKAIILDNIYMYFVCTAKDVVDDCIKQNIMIFGFEAFKLTGLGIQPSMEHSIDFKKGQNNWEEAINFLSNIRDTTYLYEIWYEGY